MNDEEILLTKYGHELSYKAKKKEKKKETSINWIFLVADINVPKQVGKETNDEIVFLFWTLWCQSTNVIVVKIMVCQTITGRILVLNSQ